MSNFPSSSNFEPSWVTNAADPLAKLKRIMFGATKTYEEIIKGEIEKGNLRGYIVWFLSEPMKRYHGPTCTRCFRTALEKQRPDLVEWFDRIQVLR